MEGSHKISRQKGIIFGKKNQKLFAKVILFFINKLVPVCYNSTCANKLTPSTAILWWLSVRLKLLI